uniref:Uncharacterized protein n=1 Tax=Meloidogyne incognita TaxID=6306 RepID=A0A914M2H8_MELIC
MKVGTVVDHTKFVQEFSYAVNELIGENLEFNSDTLIGNADKIKEVIHQFPNGQIKTFLETVEKAIEGKDEEEPFPKMATKFEEIGHVEGFKPFSVVLDEFINSKQK